MHDRVIVVFDIARVYSLKRFLVKVLLVSCEKKRKKFNMRENSLRVVCASLLIHECAKR